MIVDRACMIRAQILAIRLMCIHTCTHTRDIWAASGKGKAVGADVLLGVGRIQFLLCLIPEP